MLQQVITRKLQSDLALYWCTITC